MKIELDLTVHEDALCKLVAGNDTLEVWVLPRSEAGVSSDVWSVLFKIPWDCGPKCILDVYRLHAALHAALTLYAVNRDMDH